MEIVRTMTRCTLYRRALAASAVVIVAATTPSASAELLQYTMTWDSVSGTYGAQNFSNQTMVITFRYDTNNLAIVFGDPTATFTNGENIWVTVGGTTLSNAALDNLASNTSKLVSQAYSAVTFEAPTFLDERGRLRNFASDPGQMARLSTVWNSAAELAFIANNNAAPAWRPLTIGGVDLLVSVNNDPYNPTTGSWGVTAVPIPGTGLAAIATVGVAATARRRRR